MKSKTQTWIEALEAVSALAIADDSNTPSMTNIAVDMFIEFDERYMETLEDETLEIEIVAHLHHLLVLVLEAQEGNCGFEYLGENRKSWLRKQSLDCGISLA